MSKLRTATSPNSNDELANLHILAPVNNDEENPSTIIEFNDALIGKDSTQPKTNDESNSITNERSFVSNKGLFVLGLLAFQNCFKNLLMRYVMVEKPKFLLSTAVITVELLKFFFSASYIIFYQKESLFGIYKFIFRDDWNNSLLLIVPASCYIIQMTLEYIAFANIDAASFAVLVQLKVLFTALFFRLVLGKKLMKKQLLSLIILTVGVMLCNMNDSKENDDISGKKLTGIMATFGIAFSSGFASVYTEKVIKSSRAKDTESNKDKDKYGLAHMQCQLAIVSLVILGMYSLIRERHVIRNGGFFDHFNGPALLSCFNSSIGGLIVATVLKHADSVLKGYATAMSVVFTGVLSSHLFGTHLSVLFGMGIVNVAVSVLLYNGSGLDDVLC